MSKTVFHAASRTWLSAACAKQLDAALAAARAAGRSARPCANDSGVWRTTPNSLLSGEPWNFITGKSAGALERLDRIKTKLGDVAHIFVGLQTSADNIFVVPLDASIERGLTRPFLLTGALTAYTTPQPPARLIFPYEIVNGTAVLMPAETLEKKYPKGWADLCEHRETLRNRENGKWKHERWYAFGRSQNLTQMVAEKLIIQVTAQRPTVMLDTNGLYMTGGGSGPFNGIRPKKAAFPDKYLLALLNSETFGTIIKAQSTNLRGGYIKFSKQYIETAPVIPPGEAGAETVSELIALADRMIALRQQHTTIQSPPDKDVIARQIHATETRINAIAAGLYGMETADIV